MSNNIPHQIIVTLHISRDEYLKYYQGDARTVVATAQDGRIVRFPAGVLQKVVTTEGVHGTFAIQFDANHKFDRIVQL